MEMIQLPGKWENWTIQSELGSGVCSVVYRITNPSDEREVAVKIIRISKDNEPLDSLLVDLMQISPGLQTDYYKRLVTKANKEIQILEKLKRKPNIVKLYDYATVDSEHETTIYIFMEYLQDFWTWYDTFPFEETRIMDIGIQICAALETCYREKILHKDLKLENILVSEENIIKLTDFGISISEEESLGTISSSPQGTILYMAPEVMNGKPYTVSAELYSLGLILYHLVNRKTPPFVDIGSWMLTKDDLQHSVDSRRSGKKLPVPIDGSPEFTAILQKACNPDEKKRYQSPSDMKNDLLKAKQILARKESVTEPKDLSSGKHKWLFGAGIGVICIGAVLGGYLFLHSGNDNASSSQAAVSSKLEDDMANITVSSVETAKSEDIAAISSSSDSVTPKTVSSGTADETTQSELKEYYSLGESVQDGPLKITFTGVQDSINTNEYISTEDGCNNYYFTFTVENTSDERVYSSTYFDAYADNEPCNIYDIFNMMDGNIGPHRYKTVTYNVLIPTGANNIEMNYRLQESDGETVIHFVFDSFGTVEYLKDSIRMTSENTVPIGTSVDCGPFKITVVSSEIPEDYAAEKIGYQYADDGCHYYQVDICAENISDEDQYLFRDEIHLYADGKLCKDEYWANEILSDTIDKGRKDSFYTTCTVPDDVNSLELEYFYDSTEKDEYTVFALN